MALINCPECGHQMSDTAKKCPKCGYTINRPQKIKWFSIIGVFGIVNFNMRLICLFDKANHFPYGISLMCGLLAIYTFLIGSSKYPLPSRLWAFVYCTIGYNIFLFSAIYFGRNVEEFDELFLYPFGNILYFIIFVIWLYFKNIKITGSNTILKICLMLAMVILPLLYEFSHKIWHTESTTEVNIASQNSDLEETIDPFTKWNYTQDVDDLTGELTGINAHIGSTNFLTLNDGSSDRLVLQLCYNGISGEPSTMFGLAFQKGNLSFADRNSQGFYVVFDNGEVDDTWTMCNGGGKKAIVMMSDGFSRSKDKISSFIEKLKKAKTCKIQVNVEGAGRKTFEFNCEGLNWDY